MSQTQQGGASLSSSTGSVGQEQTRLLTADDLAVRWQVELSQVYRLTRLGVLPKVRLGRYYRYRLDKIEAFEAAGGVASGE